MDPIEKILKSLPDKTYFRIGEVARITRLKPYVLRFWETEFKMVSPPKSRSGQRMYRKKDIETVLRVKQLLYKERFTIEGARKRLAALRRQEAGTAAGEEGRRVSSSELRRIRGQLEKIRELVTDP
ncbi:MAG: MerR family transcriptional regulator [Myxococcota bacterium]